MDVEEAVRRLRANLIIIVGVILIGVVAAAGINLAGDPAYRASTRILFDVRQPRSSGSAEANADAARGIVASSGRVAAALKAAGLGISPERFARDNVRLRAVGASSVIELSVTYRRAAVAAKIANSLADELILVRNELSKGGFAELFADIDRRLGAANEEVARRQGELQQAAGARGLSPVRENYQEAVRNRDALEAEKRRLLKDYAERPQAAIIERATRPRQPEPTNFGSDVTLGSLLGLILGIGLAGLRETLRPTVAGERALANLLGAPSLGTLARRPNAVDETELMTVASRVRLAADAAGVRTIALTAAGPSMDVDALAARLADAIDVDENGLRLVSPDMRRSIRVFSAEGDGLRALGEVPSTVGLVLVAPRVLKRSHLDALADLRSMTGWQLLGVITYRRRGRSPSGEQPALPQPVAGTDGDGDVADDAAHELLATADGNGQVVDVTDASAPREPAPEQAANGAEGDGSRGWAPSRWQ